jgi:hypothetical protein
MADILVVDWTTVSEVTKGSFMEGFELTSYADGSTLDLSSSRYESIGGILYLVSGGNVSVNTSAATIDGTYYIHVKDDGDQTASAFLNSNAGTFNGELGGYYYNGGKVTHRVEKVSSSFNGRVRLINTPKKAIVEEFHAPVLKNGDTGLPEATNGLAFPSGNIIDVSAEISGTIGAGASTSFTALPSGFTYQNSYVLPGRQKTAAGTVWYPLWQDILVGGNTINTINVAINQSNQYSVVNNDTINARDYYFTLIRFF